MAVIGTQLPLILLYSPVVIIPLLFAGYLIWIVYNKKRAVKLLGHYVHVLPEIPIIGNSLTFAKLGDSTGFWKYVSEITSKYRQGVLFSVFHLNWIFLQEIDVVEAILMNQENSDKSYVYSLLSPITDGVFACNGLRWRKLRKKLNLTFSQKQIDFYMDDVNQQAAICIEVLNKKINKYINVRSYLAAYFVDIIFRTHFDVQTREQYTRKHQITERSSKMIEVTMAHRFFNVFLHPQILYQLSQLCQFIRNYRIIPVSYVRKTAEMRMKRVKMEKEQGLYKESNKLFFVDMSAEVLSELNIEPTPIMLERNGGDVIVAASDTTSVTVTTLIYYLSIYPEIQEKIYQEVAPIFGEKKTKYLTKDDLSKMVYLEMAIKETLRLTAPPGIVREIPKDTDVGKYVLPKGINTFIAMKAIHENPAYWEKPTQFYPEHFLPEKVKERPKYSFLPFSIGPRNCPGMSFSYVTMKIILSSIIRNYKLETDIPLESITFKMVIMQEIEQGFRIKLTPRPN